MIELFGDVASFILPLITLIKTKNKIKFTNIYIRNMIFIFILKYLSSIERPNKKDKLSFPSGHMGSTYTSSIYYLKEFNSYKLLPFSILTGFSRIYTRNHSIYDLVGSIFISHYIKY